MCPQYSSSPIWEQPCWRSRLGKDIECLNPLLEFQPLATVIGSGMGTWPKMGQSELNSEIFVSGWRKHPLILSGQSCVWKGGLCREVAAKSLQSCPTLCDPIDGSPPGSPVPGILHARTLEWLAISFSNAWKWKVKVKSLSRVRPLAWTAAYQAPLSMGFFQARVLEWGAIAFSECQEVGNHFSPSKGKLSSGWSRHTTEVRAWRTVENGSQSPTQTLAVEFSDTWDRIFSLSCFLLLAHCPTRTSVTKWGRQDTTVWNPGLESRVHTPHLAVRSVLIKNDEIIRIASIHCRPTICQVLFLAHYVGYLTETLQQL